MSFTLVVTGHGRWGYYDQCMKALDSAVGLNTFFDRVVISVDGGVPWVNHFYGLSNVEYHQLPSRQGLTANLARAWGALTTDDEWVFHVEEDFVIRDAPLAEMAATLDAFPFVANMVLVRQPWNQVERRFGSVLPTIPGLVDRGGWQEHRRGFWLNPFVAPASLLRTLQPGPESSLTEQCLARGLSFGYWGGRDDEPRCEHIGASGGMNSPGWKP